VSSILILSTKCLFIPFSYTGSIETRVRNG